MTTAEGNGIPTGDAVLQGLKYLQTLTDDNPKYVLLATDGEPSCPDGSDEARAHAVDSIGTAAAAGVHTFVLGVATSVSNDVAIAGGEPQSSDPNPLARRFIKTTAKNMVEIVFGCPNVEIL